MADVLIRSFSKILSLLVGPTNVAIDNWTFQMFYKVTPMLLGACVILVCTSQFFGEPIACDAGEANGGIERAVLDAYCWMYSSWNIPQEYKGACTGGDQPQAPKVFAEGSFVNPLRKDQIQQRKEEAFFQVYTKEDEMFENIVYNSYYQWVPLYLTFLAFFFYLPRYIWLKMEGGLMKLFRKGTTARFIEDQDEKREKLVQFFCRNIHNKYNIYFCGFAFCEFLNFAIVGCNFFLTHRFLHYRFLDYGYQVWQYYLLPPEEQRMPGVKNPMCSAFPRVAFCDYWRFGTGGHQENVNAVCILALNIINDKVFLILWWWMGMLGIIASLRLVYRLVQMKSAWIRYELLNMRMNRYFRKSKRITKIEIFIRQCKLGDWFVLYQLSKNLNRPFFVDFLTHLSIRYTESGGKLDEEDPEETENHSQLLRPSYTPKSNDYGIDRVDRNTIRRGPIDPDEKED